MPWFFTDKLNGSLISIEGEDALHIEKSLRMKAGEEITLCDNSGMQHSCIIENISPGNVAVRVLKSIPCQNEPTVSITLYQALPKGDKMDTIVQKAVELGATEIVPMLSSRCVSRPDEKSAKKKVQRWQKIAKHAAEQSRRGIIPKVLPVITFDNAVSHSGKNDLTILFYECGGENLNNIIPKACQSISVFIGSEGGFEEKEAEMVIKSGGKTATLGKRILRAETAPLTALSVIMYETGNLSL